MAEITREPQRCLLRQLPNDLIARVWPAERVLMAGRTSQWLRQEVSPRIPRVKLFGNSAVSDDEFTAESVASSLCLFTGCVEVKWVGPRGRQLLRGIIKARESGFVGAISTLILEGSWMCGGDNPVAAATGDTDRWKFQQVSDVAQLLTKTLSLSSSSLVHLSLALAVGDLSADEHPFASVWDHIERSGQQDVEADFLDCLSECSQLRDLRLSGRWLKHDLQATSNPVLPPQILGALTRLELRDIGAYDPLGAGFQALVDLMPETCALDTLIVRNLGLVARDGVLSIGRKCPALRCLDLRGNLISSAAGDVVNSLACCNNLTSLNLSDNELYEDATTGLADSIGSLHQLRTLDLSDNRLNFDPAEDWMVDHGLWLGGDARPGMSTLAGVLAAHPSLQMVDLSNNEFDSGVIETLKSKFRSLPTPRM